MLVLQLLFVIGLANGAPILADYWLGRRWQQPVDCGWTFLDGRPLFGASKTWRGLVAGGCAAVIAAVTVGLSPGIGLWLGAGAMGGDLLSSFVKRRLGLAPSDMALGLDQIPEALLPLLLVQRELALQPRDILVLTALFLASELLLSQVLFRLHIRKRPY